MSLRSPIAFHSCPSAPRLEPLVTGSLCEPMTSPRNEPSQPVLAFDSLVLTNKPLETKPCKACGLAVRLAERVGYFCLNSRSEHKTHCEGRSLEQRNFSACRSEPIAGRLASGQHYFPGLDKAVGIRAVWMAPLSAPPNFAAHAHRVSDRPDNGDIRAAMVAAHDTPGIAEKLVQRRSTSDSPPTWPTLLSDIKKEIVQFTH